MTTTEIIICNSCKGSGKLYQSECTNYHHGYYQEWDEQCTTCNGTGRLIKETNIRKMTNNELKLKKKPIKNI